MSDETVQRAVREVERHGQTMAMAQQLLASFTPDQLVEFSKVFESRFYKQLPWLEDIESYYFEVVTEECGCIASHDDDGFPLNSRGEPLVPGECQECDGSGMIFLDGNLFQEAIQKTGAVAFDLAVEHLQADNDWGRENRALEATKKSLFVRYLNIDDQFIKYLVVYPAPAPSED